MTAEQAASIIELLHAICALLLLIIGLIAFGAARGK